MKAQPDSLDKVKKGANLELDRAGAIHGNTLELEREGCMGEAGAVHDLSST